MVHQAALRAESTARLGVAWAPRAVLATRNPKAHRSAQPELSDHGLHDRWLADATKAGAGP